MPADAHEDLGDGSRSDPGQQPSDHSLLRRLRGGNQEAARDLYERYAARLYALARSRQTRLLARTFDAEDIVQSAFRCFFRKVLRGTYDVPASEELWNLLMVITLNKVRSKSSFYHAAKRDVRRLTSEADIEKHPGPSVLSGEAIALLRLTVEEALDHLPPQHRLVVGMRMRGEEVSEIASKAGRSRRSVERILQASRERLAKLID